MGAALRNFRTWGLTAIVIIQDAFRANSQRLRRVVRTLSRAFFELARQLA